MNIQILGYYDRNFGDDVMRLITINNMPDCEFYVDCPQKEFLLHLRGCGNVHLYDKNVDIDAYVNVIGTGFKYESKMSLLSKMVSIPYEKSFAGKKSAVIDCSVDMPKNILEHMLVKRELNKYKLISCRDAVSEKIMSDMTRKSIVKCHEDIVFALDRKYIYERTDEGCLGIVPVQRGYSESNFPYYTAAAKACDRYIHKYGKKVLLFAFDTGNENDTIAVMTIRRLMEYHEMTEIIAYDSQPEYVFKNMARCGKIISSRFHGVIAAILAGVPVAAVSDTSKIDILSEKLGFERIMKSSLTAEAMFELAERTDKAVQLDENIKTDAMRHLETLREYLTEQEALK